MKSTEQLLPLRVFRLKQPNVPRELPDKRFFARKNDFLPRPAGRL
jgi:hypothetical protein